MCVTIFLLLVLCQSVVCDYVIMASRDSYKYAPKNTVHVEASIQMRVFVAILPCVSWIEICATLVICARNVVTYKPRAAGCFCL